MMEVPVACLWCRLSPIRFIRLTTLLFFCFGSVAVASPAGVPDGGVLEFDILRNGNAIGHHILQFEPNGKNLEVRVDAQVDYRLGFIPLYRFEHSATEFWHNDRLLTLTATTRDNGDDYNILLRPAGDRLQLSINGDTVSVEPEIVPASLWNIAVVKQRLLLDPADGELMQVQTEDIGPETITVRGRPVAAHHYVMTGDFERDLWYDANGVLVQVRFKGDDGSEIRYGLR